MSKYRLIAANYNTGTMWAYERLQNWLEQHGVDFVIAQIANDEELLDQAAEADIFLAYKLQITRHIISALPRLKLIMSSGSGYDHIDVGAATDHGVVVTNARMHNVEDVAELALGLILACGRKINLIERRVRDGAWRPDVQPIARVQGKTLGLVGFGNIARALAWRAKGIGMRVIATSSSSSPEDIRALGVEPVDINTLLQESDFVSLHLVANDVTNHTLDATRLRMLKPNAFVINTSRGQLIDEPALIRALQESWIAGAGLDVLTNEPPEPDNPLLGMDNVVVTGHSAASTQDATQGWVMEWMDTLNDFLQGEMPSTVVNPSVQPKISLQPNN